MGVGFLVLDSYEKIEILQHLITSGYCLSTSIWAEGFFYGGEEGWNSGKDVILLDGGVSEEEIANFSKNLNHAQTIVGYQMGGNAWDPENLDGWMLQQTP